MHASSPAEPLPPTRTLSRAQQVRWLGIVVGVLVGIAILVMLIGKLTHHEPAPPPSTPPGTLRLTPQ
ncbi:hypothetical protein ACTGYR_11235, partial [Streptococcus suis]